MINPGSLQVSTPNDREILMTRVFDAPRRLVFDAFTKPELMRRWFFGPPGWTLAVCEPGRAAGDAYRYVWRSPDGMEMGMGGTLLEIVPPERLVATEKFDQAWYPGEAVSSILLTEYNGKTTLTQTIKYESKEARDMVLQSPMEEGMSMGYDRLAEVLASLE